MKVAVSFIVPMYNAEATIRQVLESIVQQDYPAATEIIVVDDGSTDRSLQIASEFKNKENFIIISQHNKGAAAATNRGLQIACHDIVCSVDADVVLEKDWLKKIVPEFDDPRVGAVQGNYLTPRNVSFWARMAGYDMEKRYDDIATKYVTQVNSGNTAYRKSALLAAGLFDPRFTYAYDNDMSYRLLKSGFLLIFRKDAATHHYWKSNLKAYLKQQFWSGYGRLQVIQKHTQHLFGDSVSNVRMILQVPATLTTVALLAVGAVTYSLFKKPHLLTAGFILLILILFDRLLFAVAVIKKQKDSSALWLPFVHVLRNLAWCWALLLWGFDNLTHKKNNHGNIEKSNHSNVVIL